MSFSRPILSAFVSTSLFFLGAVSLSANTTDRDAAEYSFSVRYTAESQEDTAPRYSPV